MGDSTDPGTRRASKFRKVFVEFTEEPVYGSRPQSESLTAFSLILSAFRCCLERDGSIEGDMFLTKNFICFYGKLGRKVTRVSTRPICRADLVMLTLLNS